MNRTWLISHQKQHRRYSHCQVKLTCYVMLVFRRLMIKTLQLLSSPMKHLEFNRSPKQALSVRDVNKPRTSRSTLSICGTLYFSGSYSPSTGVSPSERKITEALLFRFSTAKEVLFLIFLLPFFFLLEFDTLVLEPIE